MKKRLLTVVFVALVTLVALAGCGKNSDDAEPTNQTEEVTVYQDFLVECSSLEEYREEVLERTESSESFISAEEEKFFEDCSLSVRNGEEGYLSSYNELYDETTHYYYPVVSTDEGQIVLWYTSEFGDVYTKEFKEDSLGTSDWVGNAHHELGESQVSMEEVANWCLFYEQATGNIERWSFGTLLEEYEVPKGAVYAGESFWEGYIFRNGTDVYALKEDTVVVIAHDVEQVVTASYCQTDDRWSQPLFLMTDGSLKVYVGWEGNQAKADDADHLVEIIYEGGWLY